MIWKKQPVGSKLSDLQNNKASKDMATQSAAGLMSAADKTKLDGIETGATAVSVVNNLNSDSATSALSAAQGKALNSKLINYQSGNWTPSFERDTVSNMYASWIAIGNILFITAQWSNTHVSGASYINAGSLPSIPGKRLNYGLHGTWRSNTTDAAGEIGQYTESSSIRFSKGGVGVELPNEPISFNAFAFLINT